MTLFRTQPLEIHPAQVGKPASPGPLHEMTFAAPPPAPVSETPEMERNRQLLDEELALARQIREQHESMLRPSYYIPDAPPAQMAAMTSSPPSPARMLQPTYDRVYYVLRDGRGQIIPISEQEARRLMGNGVAVHYMRRPE